MIPNGTSSLSRHGSVSSQSSVSSTTFETGSSTASSRERLSSLPPIPPQQQHKKDRFEFKLFGHFPARFENITAQCYHSSQQILVLGSEFGEVTFVGGDVHHSINISTEYRIESIQYDADDYQKTNFYILCNHRESMSNHTILSSSSSIIICYDFAKKQIIQQVTFQPTQYVQNMKCCKSYLLLTILDITNPNMMIPYVKYMSTSNFKFISTITLLHPMLTQMSQLQQQIPQLQQQPQLITDLQITFVEPHPQYDHVVAVGYSNGDTIIYYIYHIQNTSSNMVATNLNCITIPSNERVTCLNWHTPTILISGYGNGTFTLYEINHPTFQYSKYYEMNILKGSTSFLTSLNQYIIFGLKEDSVDAGIYYLKMNYEVKSIEFIRNIWCEGNDIHNVTPMRSVFDNSSILSLFASVIYGPNRNILVLDLLERMAYQEKELQLFNIEKYSVPTPFYSINDLQCKNDQFVMLKASTIELSNLIYNTCLNNYNNESYRKNILEYYMRPANRWNVLGIKHSQYRVDVNTDDDNYILAKLSDTEFGSAIELYLCKTYFHDVRYIYTIENQSNYKLMCKWNDSVIVLCTCEGHLDFLHVPSATIFSHNIANSQDSTNTSGGTPTSQSSLAESQNMNNTFQSLISQIARHNFSSRLNCSGTIVKMYPIQIINQLLLVYDNGTIKVVSIHQDLSNSDIIENGNDHHFGSVIFELVPSDMKPSEGSPFIRNILPKSSSSLNQQNQHSKDSNHIIITSIECSSYHNCIYALIGYASGRLCLIHLYDLDYMTKHYAKFNKYILSQRWKDLADVLSPICIHDSSSSSSSNSSMGKIIDIYTVNDIYNEYNTSHMIDHRFLPPRLRKEYATNCLLNSSSSPLCYTIYSNSLMNVFGTAKNSYMTFPIDSNYPLVVLFQTKKALALSFQFTLDILDIKFYTISKIDQIASYGFSVNGVSFEFDIDTNYKIVQSDQIAIAASGSEYRIYVRNNTSSSSSSTSTSRNNTSTSVVMFECIGSSAAPVDALLNQYITNMNIKLLSHHIHDKEMETEFSTLNRMNMCDMDYLSQYIDHIEIFNNMSFTDMQGKKATTIQPEIVGFLSQSGIPPLGQPHGLSRSKYIIVVRQKGIEEYILEAPMIRLKKFSLKEGRKYTHPNMVQTSAMEYVGNLENQSLILLDNQFNLMIFTLRPSLTQNYKSFECVYSHRIQHLYETIFLRDEKSLPHHDSFHLKTFDHGKDVFLFNNEHIYMGTLFDPKYHKSKDILEPILYTIDYKPSKMAAVGESIVSFFKSFTKSTPNEKDLNDTFWKICSQLQREDLNIVQNMVIAPTSTSSSSQPSSDFHEKTIVSTFLSSELVKPLPKPPQKSSPSTVAVACNSTQQPRSVDKRELLLGPQNDASVSNAANSGSVSEQRILGSDSASMKRSELNQRLEETKQQMQENLRKLNEREEKLREIKEKTNELSNSAKSFGANAQRLTEKSKGFWF
ncbi:hypothetical protein C9374_008651 [Naegleria lovaniensis]|uniref:V-SNARE coiled-coil homology domain-containing protein n=1 Tax=Naegleria lovaniensis TaxID=51637 RepID=A0AA88KKP3_NAELO|nr:uncharacterized protein C9374_008651 [Naegleria lovaniensis]KAG2378029.1 hypothetical protein C9374_008651 [Naegleria lovaniensis]